MNEPKPGPMTPQERYQRDPDFRMLVDVLTEQIHRCQYTPTELREAAVLACIRYETLLARPAYLIDSETGQARRVDSWHGKEPD